MAKGTRNIIRDPTSLKDKVNKGLYREMHILKFVNTREQLIIIQNVLIRF